MLFAVDALVSYVVGVVWLADSRFCALQSLKSLSLGSRIRNSIRPRISAAEGLLSCLGSARDFEISSALPKVSEGRVLGSTLRYTARELSWRWNLTR